MNEPLLFELARPDYPGPRLPASGVPEQPLDRLVPLGLRRAPPLAIPSLRAPGAARHLGPLGAHGEWTGLLMIEAYHRSRGEHRDQVLVPDSAHGTNPASAALSRLQTIPIKTGPDGLVHVDDFRTKLSPRVAAVMLTNPNTLGLFETDIVEIARLAHEQGAQL